MRLTSFIGAALGSAALLSANIAQAESLRPGQSLVSASAAAKTPMPQMQSRRGAKLEETSWLVQTVVIAIIVGGLVVGYATYEIVTDEPESP